MTKPFDPFAEPVFEDPADPRERIVDTARREILAGGYQAFTMDALARELGMSKKTLYVHFPGKDAIVAAFTEAGARRVERRLQVILDDPTLDFPARLDAVMQTVGNTLGRVSPIVLREFQRFLPDVYRRLEEVRARLIPRVFGRLIEEGIAQGHVRADIDPAFAAFAWLKMIQGLVQPDALEHTGLSPRQTVAAAFRLVWPGLLTPQGHVAVAHLLDRAGQHATPTPPRAPARRGPRP